MEVIECPKCGQEVSRRREACPNCGCSVPRRAPDAGDDFGMRMVLPVGRSGWAIAAGYLGLVSVLCVPGPLALLCGIMAVIEMRRDPTKHGMGRAIFGIIMGGITSLFLFFALIAMIIEQIGKR